MSFRKQQIESTLKRAISQVLSRQISDPRIVGLVSVTQVDVSPDLHDAIIYVSVLPPTYQKRTLAGLRHAAGYIQQLALKAMSIKAVPRLDFRVDDAIKKEAAVLDAIRRGVAQDRQNEAMRPTPEDAGAASGEMPAGPEDRSK